MHGRRSLECYLSVDIGSDELFHPNRSLVRESYHNKYNATFYEEKHLIHSSIAIWILEDDQDGVIGNLVFDIVQFS